jgi:hypothetical protein
MSFPYPGIICSGFIPDGGIGAGVGHGVWFDPGIGGVSIPPVMAWGAGAGEPVNPCGPVDPSDRNFLKVFIFIHQFHGVQDFY